MNGTVVTTAARALSVLGMLFLAGGPASAQEDQPHSRTQNLTCLTCHLSHELFGNQIGSTAGNANLCLSCHQTGAAASRQALAEYQQAQLGPDAAGQPPATGRSHRWDARVSGRVEALSGATAEALATGGSFTGRHAVSYTVTIASPGRTGTARFNWTGTGLGAGSGVDVATGTDVALEQGLTLSFRDVALAFAMGDQWRIFVRPGLNEPTNASLLAHMTDDRIVCSTCHNSHSQAEEPFDPQAPPYLPGAGAGRHYLRVASDQDQLCAECHAVRFVTNAVAGSHAVGMLVASNALLHPPAALPLDKQQGRVQCETCHQVHNSPGNDGTLLRVASRRQLCAECHALADTTAPASHLNPLTGPLWPGGQYGSQRPAETDLKQRGSCDTCHRVHGWPDPASATNDYPGLLVEREENVCYTCHDGSPAGKNVRANFNKTYRHPVALAGRHTTTEDGNPARYGTANRHSECADCHNVHQLTPDAVAPTPPFASTALKGVARVAVNNLSSGSQTYTFRSAADPTPVKEYELCFLCHSGWTTQPVGQTNFAAKFNDRNPSFHPVEAVGKNLNINPVTFTNGWTETSLVYCTDCHTSDDPTLRGPHGSANPWILKRPYTRSNSPALASNGLCFECHSYAVYGANAPGSRFRNVDRSGHNHGGYNCYACHESHGSSTKPFLLGNSVTIYTKTATGGSCNPSCHGNENYSVAYPR
jgi:predicted CXXCH cytochrome family protein